MSLFNTGCIENSLCLCVLRYALTILFWYVRGHIVYMSVVIQEPPRWGIWFFFFFLYLILIVVSFFSFNHCKHFVQSLLKHFARKPGDESVLEMPWSHFKKLLDHLTFQKLRGTANQWCNNQHFPSLHCFPTHNQYNMMSTLVPCKKK